MVLEIICEDKDYCTDVDSNEEKQEKISWAEIIQCYRICVVGICNHLKLLGLTASFENVQRSELLAVLYNYSHSITVSAIACDTVP